MTKQTDTFDVKLYVPKRAVKFLESALEELASAVLTRPIEKQDPLYVRRCYWEIQCIFEQKPNAELLRQIISDACRLGKTNMPEYRINKMPAVNWVQVCYQGFQPISVGKYYIYGSHIEEKLPADKITLKIDAATAFGTGEHATTNGCLQALDKYAYPNQNVLDVGCGSGILGMAYAKTYNKTVDAVDIDDEAVRVTCENADKNELKNLMNVWQSNGYDGVEKTYDLILCNILAKPLIAMAPALKKHLTSGGRAILSGFLLHQESWVKQAHLKAGLKVVDRFPVGEWGTLVVEKE